MLRHLGDGTFGRCLKCVPLDGSKEWAVKVIRAVARYTDSARIEVDILEDMKRRGGCEKGIVYLKDYFIHEDSDGLEKARRLAFQMKGHTRDVRTYEYRNMCLAFEPLGKSLFDFIK